MSEFLLVIPAGYIDVDVEAIVGQTTISRNDFQKYESGTDLYEITDALRQLGFIGETTEVAYAKWLADVDRFLVKLS